MHLSTQVCKTETLLMYRILYLLRHDVRIKDSTSRFSDNFGFCIISLLCLIFFLFSPFGFLFFSPQYPLCCLAELKIVLLLDGKATEVLLEQDPNINQNALSLNSFQLW